MERHGARSWKTPVAGRGWSSPVVAGNRVWLTTAVTKGNAASLRLLGFDFDSGREAVNVEVATVHQMAEWLNE
jgi:outer membrane protein assembly factor BamB